MAFRSVSRAVRTVILAVALMAPLGAAPAFAQDYLYWYVHPQTKTYPSTTPGPSFIGTASEPSTKTLTLTAAKAEFEGRQIAIRPTDGAIRDVWLEPSDLVRDGGGADIDASNVEVFKVDYVTIAVASKGYTRKGQPEPDPLIPMTLANGQRLGWNPGAAPSPQFRTVASGRTQPYYVLFHVPADAEPGIYRGTIRVSCEGVDDSDLPNVVVPVQLEVYPFSIAKRTLKTSFGLSLNYAMYANSAEHTWLKKGSGQNRITETTDVKGDQIGGWLKYFSDHRISPQTMLPAWDTVASNGTMTARDPFLNDYLGTGAATTFGGSRYDFSTAMMPEPFARPSYLSDPFYSSANLSKATAYYSSMRSELNSWLSKAFVYPVDEPTYSRRGFVEKYAALVHQAAPGVKFLLTTDPVTMKYVPLKGVDIYVQRLHFYYRDYSRWIGPLRKAGKQIWLYTHAGSFQTQAPNYLIDGPLADVRAHGWFAHHTGASGVLYFNVAAWRETKGSSKRRDPYVDPLSNRYGNDANGDGSLVYPGYYPAKGLVIQGAPPVGSLRMEALRDGLEDYEYLKLVEAKRGRATTLGVYTARVIGKPKTVISATRPTFPAYPRTAAPYDVVRASAAYALSR